MDPKKYYTENLDHLRSRQNRLTILLNWLSFFRLAIMALTIFFLVKGIKHDSLLIVILSALLFIGFFIIVSYHKKKDDERKITREKIKINEDELLSLEGNYQSFYKGQEFLDPEHEFTYDLDIFGPDSLYQFICRCCTFEGRKALASRFLNSPMQEEDIIRNQEIHTELSKKPGFIQEYLATGNVIEEKAEESEQIKKWMDRNFNPIPRKASILAVLLMGLNTTIIVLSFFMDGIINYLLLSAIASWLLYGIFFSAINRYHSDFGKKQETIRKYNRLSIVLANEGFHQNLLEEYTMKAGNSIKSIRQLEKLMDLFDTRLNLLMGAILNTIFLLDFHLIYKLEKWKKKNSGLLKDIFTIHAETDAYISGAIYQFNHPEFIRPVPVTKGFNGKELGHPLMKPGKCIPNDFCFEKDENIILITGANMAGKSTFLRTIGVNLILAGSGYNVMARKFEFDIHPLITGMRTTDSLAESESYFYAELKRLKRIMDRLRNNEKLYILLDEILKGTNSTDKHKGSEELLKQMAEYDSKVFIATHDLELGKLEDQSPEKIRNYHFESYISQDELVFDYKIQKGIAVNMNASFLLKKMEILKN